MGIFRRNPYRDLPPPPRIEERYSLNEWIADVTNTFSIGGNAYTLPVQFTQSGKKQSAYPVEYLGMVTGIKTNGPLFAVMDTRSRLFSEAEFIFKDNETGALTKSDDLGLLQEPWPNGTTGDWLKLIEMAVSLGGNSYTWRNPLTRRLHWLRPDWVSIVLASQYAPDSPGFALDAEIVGYVYEPYGAPSGVPPTFMRVDEVAHWTPIPDPVAPWRGMSWMTPILREIMADSAATDHKLSFFEHGATPNIAIKFPESITNVAKFKELRDAINDSHSGTANAWKTLYLTAGADVQVVGVDLGKLDFGAIQGVGEVRIAVAGGIPASVVGFNEALQGSSLNAGNFTAARRLCADLWARPQWRSMCAAHAKLVNVPQGSRLWYDERNIAFLREDQQVEAQIQQTRSSAVQTLINSGYEADAAVTYIMTNDPSVLVGHHSGLVSVQLQPPGVQVDSTEPPKEPKKPAESAEEEQE